VTSLALRKNMQPALSLEILPGYSPGDGLA
jgi:hypothetical protein